MKHIFISALAAAMLIGGTAAAQSSASRRAARNTQQQTSQQAQTQQQNVQAAQPQNIQTAQPAQQIVTVSGNAAVPVTTVVPVQQAPTTVVSYTTVTEPAQQLPLTQRRAIKSERFAARMDSLVRSRNFVFYPSSMQETPGGTSANIIADYFYFGIFNDLAEIHLPVINGTLDLMQVLNFDSAINDYRFYPFQAGTSFTFSLQNGNSVYFARFIVSNVTGETTLMLVTPETTMRYAGWLSIEKLHDD